MYALIENNEIKKIYNKPRALTIGDIQYPSNIFSLWSKEEKEAKGIYEVVFDNSNKKDEAYYTNTNQSFDYADGQVTASYGTATPKELGAVKSLKKTAIKSQASGLLTPLDWHVIKATEVESYSVPEAITTYRADVRSTSNTMETAIDNAADVDALAALYVYTDGTRPLGEFPILEA